MDPLSALAIVAATFQFLELGGKLCIKALEKYNKIQENIHDNKKFAEEEEEEELKRTFEELSSQISWYRTVSTSIVVSRPPTSTQIQLLKLSSRCTTLSSDFERIKSQMKLPNSREVNLEIHLRDHARTSRRQTKVEDCKECQQRKNEENEEIQKNRKEIEKITKKLEPLKREIMDFIFLSLWDDSKRTQQWELHFSNQLGKLIELLGSAEELSANSHPKSVSPNQEASSQVENFENNMREPGTAVSTIADEKTAELRNALQPWIQPEKGPISMKQLANDMIEYLEMDSGAINAIRGELINILWKRDWELNTSMTSAVIDTAKVGHAIATGIRFNTIHTREDAILKSFEGTYTWIFQEEPLKKGNKLMWDSYPKWLDDSSQHVYWITGKPGSGKSTIMKLISEQQYLAHRLSQSMGPLRLVLVNYYAWLAGATLQKSIEGLKRTMVFQALEEYPDLASVLAPRRWAFCQVLRSISNLPKWNDWEIEESFEALLSLCGKTIKLALFIDGLDEFDTPPVTVVECIQYITARCPQGLKLCAASRPWPEFYDEFDKNPMLQIHLLTENDIRTFVEGVFKGSKGLAEQEQLHPKAVSQLVTDIVQRANGVFLWVSIVVEHLSSCFSAGQSIFQAREVLEILPLDISSLYSAIWDRIPSKNRADASYMIQVLRAYDGPISWFTLWVIDESRFAQMTTMDLPRRGDPKKAALRSLKRKLAACTKCILEISGDGDRMFVDFIHRTARDWAIQDETWSLICSSYGGTSDPQLGILKAEVLLFHPGKSIDQMKLWDIIAGFLWRAGEVKDTPNNGLELVNCLNCLNDHFDTLLEMNGGEEKNTVKKYQTNHTPGKTGQIWPITPDFLGLAAQFSILPYIRYVALSDPQRLSPKFSKDSLSFLESAIFGYSYFLSSSWKGSRPEISLERRLATVKYLLEEGVYQSKVHTPDRRIRDLKEEMREVFQNDLKYYSGLLTYFDERESRMSAESLGIRIRSLFSKLRK